MPFVPLRGSGTGELYFTLSSMLPCVYLLHGKTTAYYRNRSHNGYGVIFARNVIASLRDRFVKYPDFLFMKLKSTFLKKVKKTAFVIGLSMSCDYVCVCVYLEGEHANVIDIQYHIIGIM